MAADTQECLDRLYWKQGPCCAGCDHWRHLNALVGECCKEGLPNLALGRRRMSLIRGLSNAIIRNAITARHDHCVSFVDGFPWEAMPLSYLERIGAKV